MNMLNKEKNAELLEFEKRLSEVFLERHLKEMVDKEPKEIIQSYIQWRHNRYTVIEEESMFFVIDMYSQSLPVAAFIKKQDPDAFNHAWIIAEMLNDLPDNVCSIDNRVFEFDFYNTDTTLRDIFDTTNIIAPNINPLGGFTIDDVIKNNTNEEDEED